MVATTPLLFYLTSQPKETEMTFGITDLQNETETEVELQTTNLFNAGMIIQDEIIYVNSILDPIENLECYTIAWYHDNEKGQAIIYSQSFEQIQNNLPEGMNAFKFLDNQLVKKYLEINCLHLNSSSEIPEDYDITIGVLPIMACTKYHTTEWCEEQLGRTFDPVEGL